MYQYCGAWTRSSRKQTYPFCANPHAKQSAASHGLRPTSRSSSDSMPAKRLYHPIHRNGGRPALQLDASNLPQRGERHLPDESARVAQSPQWLCPMRWLLCDDQICSLGAQSLQSYPVDADSPLLCCHQSCSNAYDQLRPRISRSALAILHTWMASAGSSHSSSSQLISCSRSDGVPPGSLGECAPPPRLRPPDRPAPGKS